MKKILSGIISLALALSMSTSVFASTITNSDSPYGWTEITYGMDQGFVVTIPADFTIYTQTNKATAEVTASNVMIPDGTILEVAVSGNDYVNSWELVDTAEAGNRLDYIIGSTDGDDDIVNNGVVLAVDAGDAYNSTVTETMYFEVVDTLTKAGTYTDTLTFTVSIVISFTLDGTTYYAKNGMNWEEWVSSNYNPGGYAIDDDTWRHFIGLNGRSMMHYEHVYVGQNADDIIINNGVYVETGIPS